MYIVPIAWLYVAMMMAVVEATSTTGTVLGAIITFLLYGLAPVGLLVYLMTSPSRKAARRTRQAAEDARAAENSAGALLQPDTSDHAPTATDGQVVSAVRKID